MQLGAKRAVDARATLLLEKGVVQDLNARELVYGQVSGPKKRYGQILQLYFLLPKWLVPFLVRAN